MALEQKKKCVKSEKKRKQKTNITSETILTFRFSMSDSSWLLDLVANHFDAIAICNIHNCNDIIN